MGPRKQPAEQLNARLGLSRPLSCGGRGGWEDGVMGGRADAQVRSIIGGGIDRIGAEA